MMDSMMEIRNILRHLSYFKGSFVICFIVLFQEKETIDQKVQYNPNIYVKNLSCW